MTARELKKKLIAAGWVMSEGARHTIATNPEKPEVIIPIPRHAGDIPKGTLHSILLAAGLK